jgi:hypothetical protein
MKLKILSVISLFIPMAVFAQSEPAQWLITLPKVETPLVVSAPVPAAPKLGASSVCSLGLAENSLSWSKSAGAENYTARFCVGAGCQVTINSPIACSVADPTVQCVHDNVKYDTSYSYRVWAVSQDVSNISNVATVKTPKEKDAVFVDQTVAGIYNPEKIQLKPDQPFSAAVQMKNTGCFGWVTKEDELGSQNPANNYTFGLSRVFLKDAVIHGKTNVFSFNAKAPSVEGIYNFQWQMLESIIELPAVFKETWFGEKSRNVNIVVKKIPDLIPPGMPSPKTEEPPPPEPSLPVPPTLPPPPITIPTGDPRFPCQKGGFPPPNDIRCLKILSELAPHVIWVEDAAALPTGITERIESRIVLPEPPAPKPSPIAPPEIVIKFQEKLVPFVPPDILKTMETLESNYKLLQTELERLRKPAVQPGCSVDGIDFPLEDHLTLKWTCSGFNQCVISAHDGSLTLKTAEGGTLRLKKPMAYTRYDMQCDGAGVPSYSFYPFIAGKSAGPRACSAGPTITTSSPLPDGTDGVPYSQTLAASGGEGSLTWSLGAGSTLHTGLSLSSGGVISGTPDTGGFTETRTFYIRATDSCSTGGQTDQKQFQLTVNAGGL